MSAGAYSAAEADAEEARRLQSQDDAETASLLSGGAGGRGSDAARGAARPNAPAAAAGGGGGGGGAANANANGQNRQNGAQQNGGGGDGGDGGGRRGLRLNGLVTPEQARELSSAWDQLSTWLIFLCVLWGLVAIMWLCVYAYELKLYVQYKDLPSGADQKPAGSTPRDPAKDSWCERQLPLWLGVDGGTGLGFLGVLGLLGVVLYHVIVKLVAIGNDARLNDSERQQRINEMMPAIGGLIACAVIAWLTGVFRVCWAIVGSVWAYTINRDAHVCPEPLFAFDWMRITLGWAWVGVFVTLICVSVCGLLCMAKPNPNPTNADGAHHKPNSAAGVSANANVSGASANAAGSGGANNRPHTH